MPMELITIISVLLIVALLIIVEPHRLARIFFFIFTIIIGMLIQSNGLEHNGTLIVTNTGDTAESTLGNYLFLMIIFISFLAIFNIFKSNKGDKIDK